MLGARQDVRPVAAGSRAGGETPLGAGAGAELAAVPRRRQGEVFQLVLTVYPPRLQPPRRDSDWPGPSGGPARSSTAPARAFSAQNSRPHPLLFPIQPPRDTELSCVCLLWRPRFAAAASPRLSPSPAPLPDGLLCGSAESPTPFLCGITMAAGTLYTYPENWRAFKALIAAQYSGAQVRVLSAPPHFHFGQTNRTPEFLRKFPAGKVPAFEGDDGFCVFESNAIAYYVSNEELRGSTPEAAAQVVQWVSFADSDIVPPASTWVFPTLGIMHHNKQATENAKEEVRRILGLLDAHLKTRTFLVGERVTLADITVVCTLLWLYKQVLEPSFRQAFPNTNRWFLTCINQPQFRAVLGEVKLCEKMAQFDGESGGRGTRGPARGCSLSLHPLISHQASGFRGPTECGLFYVVSCVLQAYVLPSLVFTYRSRSAGVCLLLSGHTGSG